MSVNIGVIGCGVMGSDHAELLYRSVAGALLAAVHDFDKARASALSERLGNPRGPRNPDYLLRSQELLEVYRGMKILHYNETAAHKGVAELIAQRPLEGPIE